MTDLISVLPDVPRLPDRSVSQLAFPHRETYPQMVQAFRDAGFETCADLCAVDYLTHPGRSLPDGVKAERFEVVVNLLSLSMRQRVRVRVQVPESDPVVGTLTDIYSGTDAMEREAYDMVGIIFEGHPDLTRILMPEDWEGHPLRKDYGVGRVPVAIQGSAGSSMSEHDDEKELELEAQGDLTDDADEGDDFSDVELETDQGFRNVAQQRRAIDQAALVAETAEGAQELFPRNETGSSELRREVGAVLRLPEGNFINPADIDIERRDDETMIINMGPQHPSTHGVLRLMLELDGETVLRTKPIIGYLHTGMEKTGEELTYVQGATNVTRMDYLSPLTNELVFSLATEALLGVELPPRAVWIRMLMAELQRVSSHLMWMATNGMDLGSTSMMIYGFREREMVLAFFEKTTGLRMNHNFIRPGGVAADLPDGWEDDVAVICDTVLTRTFEYDELLTGQPIFRERTEAVGNITAEEALALSVTGPILRSTGVPWDLRRTMPYLDYDKLDFDVIVGSYGDNFDRYSVRLNEIRESIKMIRQIAERMPAGDYRVQDRKVTPPPRARIDESMEALIHHFKIFTEGFRVPEGEVYVAIESPRGELGCYMVSDGTSKPYRMHIRGPSFVNLQALPVLLRGGLMADAVAVISSVDPVMGEVDR